MEKMLAGDAVLIAPVAAKFPANREIHDFRAADDVSSARNA
jgi:hypothetical protein